MSQSLTIPMPYELFAVVLPRSLACDSKFFARIVGSEANTMAISNEQTTPTPNKSCYTCKQLLPLTAFGKKRSAKDGLSYQCIICDRRYFAERRAANPEKARKNNERWRRKNPLYAQEWQSQNMERHTAANQRYRDKLIKAEKPSLELIKACTICGESKRLSEFWRTSSSKSGRMAHCASCTQRKKRLKLFGITQDQFSQMWSSQNGKCGICLCQMNETGAPHCVIDHDHKTGDIRGLLCSHCNLAIGHFKDDPERALRAADYLGKHRGKTRG
jgi:hypothetical protein